jgi:hypothetical protein
MLDPYAAPRHLTRGSAQPGNFHAGFEFHTGSFVIGTVILWAAMMTIYARLYANREEGK